MNRYLDSFCNLYAFLKQLCTVKLKNNNQNCFQKCSILETLVFKVIFLKKKVVKIKILE